MEHRFALFSPEHFLVMALLVTGGFLILYASRRCASEIAIRNLAIAIGIFMIVQELFDRGYHVLLVGDRLADVLPLHLCGMSVFLSAIMLINRSYRLFEVVYFWGLGGATMAILTPDVQFDFPHPVYITYFTSHALIIVAVCYMTLNYGYRPTAGSLLRAILITNAYMVLVFPVNLLLNTNYLFLNAKPKGATLLDALGPWPYYIAGMEVIGLAVFVLLYLPFAFARDTASSRPAEKSPP
jgi:hypothetical integral membrane protein (TIGR02206 family)